MSLRPVWFTIVLMLIIAACSDTSPPATIAAADETATSGAATNTTPAKPEAVAVQLGMVFVDADPTLMAGALIVFGTLSVGDRLEMLGDAGQRVGVRIDEIKDDASASLVSSAKAPAGVFLTFTADTPGMTARDNLLIAKDGFVDFEAAKSFVDQVAPVDDP